MDYSRSSSTRREKSVPNFLGQRHSAMSNPPEKPPSPQDLLTITAALAAPPTNEPSQFLTSQFLTFLRSCLLQTTTPPISNKFRNDILQACKKVYAAVRRASLRKTSDSGGEEDKLNSFVELVLRLQNECTIVTGPYPHIALSLGLLQVFVGLHRGISTPLDDRTTIQSIATQLVEIVIHNPFEYARAAAFSLLRDEPGWLKTVQPRTGELINTAVALSQDVSTLARLRGGMVWRLVACLESAIPSDIKDPVIHPTYASLTHLSSLLTTHLSSPTFASAAPNIHGAVEGIAYVVQDITHIQSVPRNLVRELVDGLVKACKAAVGVFRETMFLEVGEGDDDEGEEDEDEQAGEDTASQEFPRKVLIAAAWRTIRSGGLALSTIAVKLVQSHSSARHTETIITTTYHLLTKTLLEIRHWGAANWTQKSLQSLCAALVTSPTYHHLPQQWLDAVIAGIVSPAGTSSSVEAQVYPRHDDRTSGPARILLAILHGAFPDPTERITVLNETVVAPLLACLNPGNTHDRTRTVMALTILHRLVKDAKTGPGMPFGETLCAALHSIHTPDAAAGVASAGVLLLCAVLERGVPGLCQAEAWERVEAFSRMYPAAMAAVVSALGGTGTEMGRVAGLVVLESVAGGRSTPMNTLEAGRRGRRRQHAGSSAPGAPAIPLPPAPPTDPLTHHLLTASTHPSYAVRTLAARCLAHTTPPALVHTRVLPALTRILTGRTGGNALHGALCCVEALAAMYPTGTAETHTAVKGIVTTTLTLHATLAHRHPFIQAAFADVVDAARAGGVDVGADVEAFVEGVRRAGGMPCLEYQVG
ncbi:uncharacterized protein EV422DRAFT_156869 [Fimicolochytrium jonesii]|uniref:uncharacterized protein n=1 Tax=Fimicolochytrium jonesii TaxID=1396493 RepID=UPI0022FF19B6|nr:uncharacterized protein EV422DRAFT_156869 [Fimicolochytrium jonesii]KAI8826181.1 hypothetical protein EV422DRAFT_156869 [Fimicolochytrium jonesii]